MTLSNRGGEREKRKRTLQAPAIKLSPPLTPSEQTSFNMYVKQQEQARKRTADEAGKLLEIQSKRTDDEVDRYLLSLLTSWPAQLLVPFISVVSAVNNPEVVQRAFVISIIALMVQNTAGMMITGLDASITQASQQIMKLKRKRWIEQHATDADRTYGKSTDPKDYFDK